MHLFLLSTEEMKAFTQHNALSNFQFSMLQALISITLSVTLGIVLGLTITWYVGLATGAGILLLQYLLLGELFSDI